MNKKLLALVVCGLTAASMLTACGKEVDVTDTSGEPASSSDSETSDAPLENVEIMNFTAPQKGDTIIEMNIKDYGTVKFRLFPEYAETGCQNFIELAKSGYYDGLTFHRIIKDFMIQGGDPKGDGTGGASTWGGEFDGGTDPHLIHLPGAVAYANSGSTATNGSQFYIVTGQQNINDDLFNTYAMYGYNFTDNQKAAYTQNGGTPFLDGNYTVFGQVIDGLDIVFDIQYVKTDTTNDRPLDSVIIESVKVTEYNGEPVKWHISDYDWEDPTNVEPVNFTAPEEGDEIICMKIKDYGTVKFRLFPEYASKGVENFVELAKSGYYDGLKFHRVIKDFMIQGGDPNGNGTGGESTWGGKFDGGTCYELIHAAGAVAYANSGSTSTNGSQFYIVTGEDYDADKIENLRNSGYSISEKAQNTYTKVGGTPFLDGSYTVFGQVIDGLDIIFKIQSVETDATNDMPAKDVIMESVTVEKYDGSPIKWYISDYDSSETSETDDSSAGDETAETEAVTAAPDKETDTDTEPATDTDASSAE